MLLVRESGKIQTLMKVGKIDIVDEIYPLCGMTVETNVMKEWDRLKVQPNTYKRRTFYE